MMFAPGLVLAGLSLTSAPLAAAGQLSGDSQPPSSTIQPSGDDSSAADLVVVTASRREEQLINAPATMTVVTEEAIAAAPSPSFVELMRVVPGVNVTQMSARDVNITSRAPTGSLENSTLVLLDGRSIYQDFFGFVMWDFIPIDGAQIKQIEVIHGPASAVWGSNALTGVVNVITKTPRELAGNAVSIQFGQFDRTSQGDSFDGGGLFAINATHAQAPTDRFAFKISAGMLAQEAFVRPSGTIPNAFNTPYPPFQNQGTRQPRLDARADYDFPDKRRKLILAGGIAGTDGIIHTGLGPLDVQSGSTSKYGRIAYHHDQFRLQGFVNSLNGEGPLLLQVDERGQAVDQRFENQAYDVEASNVNVVGTKHVLSYGGNFRDNRFDLTLAPEGHQRAEGGTYVQDEIFFSDRIRWIVGTRVDWFGLLDKTVFSPRTTLLVKPRPQHTIRLSFNRAFRAPSFLNSYIELKFWVPVGDGSVRLPAVAEGNRDLKEESLTAYEVAYAGAFGAVTVGAAVFLNDARDQISFTQAESAGSSSALPLRFTYLNFDRVLSRGLELSLDGRINQAVTGFVNYTWQGVPEPRGFDIEELNIAPRYHVNAGVSYNRVRYFGTASASYQAEAFWQDVLDLRYHGWTEPYTLLNASAGIRSADGSMTVATRVTNLLNRSIQQHVFGDVVKRAVTGEVRFTF
jgi:outer membrane receptor for ferrienterochelin and colicin